MKTLGTILFFLFSLSVLFSSSPELMVVRLENPQSSEIDRFIKQAGWDVAGFRAGKYLDLVLSQEQFEMLSLEYPSLYVTQTENELRNNILPGKDLAGYRSYQQMLAELQQLQDLYPTLMELHQIGTGWGAIYAEQGIAAYQNFNHAVWAIKVSANVHLNEDEPAFYFVGEHHAREPLCTEVCMGILNHLLSEYGSDPQVTQILDGSEVWIVPLLNPDGHKLVIDETSIWHRKNIRDNNNNHILDYGSQGMSDDGVDLNRNYSYQWGYVYASDFIGDIMYQGPHAFSEPETQALRDLLLSKRFLAGISYHTYGEYVMYPYGYLYGIISPDRQELVALASEIAGLLPCQYNENHRYEAIQSFELYPVSGSMEDWTHATTGAFAYTIEMARQFIPPASYVPIAVQHQVNGAMALMNRMNRKILRGHITDATNGEAIAATVFVEQVDDHPVYRAPIKSDSLWGAYYYLLPAGLHTVRFICPGYATVTQTVSIDPNSPTILDIQMLPLAPFDLEIMVRDSSHKPVPGAQLCLDNDSEATYTTDDQGLITVTGFLPGEHQIHVSKPGYGTLRLTREITIPSLTLTLSSHVIWGDRFEYGLSDWTCPNTWGLSSVCHTGNWSLSDSPDANYQNNLNSSCQIANPLDLQLFENADLQFWLKTDLSLDGDHLSVEASADNNSWQLLDCYTGSNDWFFCSCDLSDFLGGPVWLRFRLYTNRYGNSEGIYIDDVMVYASSNIVPADDPALSPDRLTIRCHPNPFSKQAEIKIGSNHPMPDCELSFYNIRGQLLLTFDNKCLTKGDNHYYWDGVDLRGNQCSSGVYLLRLSSRGKPLATGKLLRVK